MEKVEHVEKHDEDVVDEMDEEKVEVEEEFTLKVVLVGAAGEGVEGPALGSLVSMVSEADLHEMCPNIHKQASAKAVLSTQAHLARASASCLSSRLPASFWDAFTAASSSPPSDPAPDNLHTGSPQATSRGTLTLGTVQ